MCGQTRQSGSRVRGTAFPNLLRNGPQKEAPGLEGPGRGWVYMVMRSRMVPTWQCCDIMVNNPLAPQRTMSARARIEPQVKNRGGSDRDESSGPAALPDISKGVHF